MAEEHGGTWKRQHSDKPEGAVERAGISAAVTSGLTMVRMENDTQASLAVQHPRSGKKVLDLALEELDIDPELASVAYYSIPYSVKKGSAEKVAIEGPSIKAAMALARLWGNCTTAVRVIEETPDYWVVEGVFLDFETNFRVLRTLRISKWQVTHAGGSYRVSGDRADKLVAAGASKAQRNAILAGLPAALVRRYFVHAKELAAKFTREGMKKGSRTLEDRMEAVGVSDALVRDYFGYPPDKLDDESLAKLLGMLTSIEEGAVTLEEAFSDDSEAGDGEAAPPPAEKQDRRKSAGVFPDAGKKAEALKEEKAPAAAAAKPKEKAENGEVAALKAEAVSLLNATARALGSKFGAWRRELFTGFGASVHDMDDARLPEFLEKLRKEAARVSKK